MVEANLPEQYKLNHYVILDGAVSQDALQVLHQWLGEMSAESLTERAWVCSAGAGAEESIRRSRDIHERPQAVSPRDDWRPFRILFLGPRGSGSFGYLMPSV
jgi:hypothetical protein